MILTSAIHAVALGFGQAPAPATLPESLTNREVRMVLQASPTHVAAENLGEELQLVLIGDLRFGASASLTLRPGQRVVYVASPAVRSQLWIEVLERNLESWHTTGALPMTSMDGQLGEQAGELWIEGGDSELIVWATSQQEDLQQYESRAYLLVPLTQRMQQTNNMHVPGAPPTEQGGDTPPKVPEKTLPPL